MVRTRQCALKRNECVKHCLIRCDGFWDRFRSSHCTCCIVGYVFSESLQSSKSCYDFDLGNVTCTVLLQDSLSLHSRWLIDIVQGCLKGHDPTWYSLYCRNLNASMIKYQPTSTRRDVPWPCCCRGRLRSSHTSWASATDIWTT